MGRRPTGLAALDMVRACTIAGEAAMALGLPQEAARMSERGLAVDRFADQLWRLQIESLEQSCDKVSAEPPAARGRR